MASKILGAFFEQNPSIKQHTPSSPDFNAIRSTFLAIKHQPSVIARPQTAEQVAALVGYCAANGVSFVIRGGGHDCHGRSTLSDALQIDMRDLKHIDVAHDKKTARIGGGVLFGDLLKTLEAEGLVTPTGTIGTVGYVGWATLGGYGQLSSKFGLGVDQIVGARIVTAEGKIVEAGERLLEGLRGGGGSLGVVVELTIKVYPNEDVQAGAIIFNAGTLSATVTDFLTNFNKLLDTSFPPDNLDLLPMVLHVPNLGNTLILGYTWFGALDEHAKEWQAKVSALGPVIMSTVKTTTMLTSVAETTAMVPGVVIPGNSQTVNIGGMRLSQAVIEATAKFVETQPAEASMIAFHSIHGAHAKDSSAVGSVFGTREDHHMMEIVGCTMKPDEADAAGKWADDFYAQVKTAEGVLDGQVYPSMAPTAAWDLKKTYGEGNYEKLLALKKEVDPKNVFKQTVPRLEP